MNKWNQIKQHGKYIQIRGNESWDLLNGINVNHSIVDIVNCTANKKYGPLIFRNAEEVYFRYCNGNMIFFHLDKDMFPVVKNIYLDCNFEPQVYSRFHDNVNIYITKNTIDGRPYYEKYKKNENGGTTDYIVVQNKHMRLISQEDMEQNLLKSLGIKNKCDRQLIE